MVNATITGVNRGTILSDQNYHIEAHTIATADNPTPTVRRAETPVYNLVIDHPDGTILWDTGSHADAGNGYWPDWLYNAFEHADADEYPLDDALETAGYSINNIDYVFQSHLHMDHAGGLHHFADTDIPVFVHEKEIEYAYYSVTTGDGSAGYIREDFDHDLNWRLIHREREQHFEDIEFIRLRGHSPGLMALMIHLDDYGTVIFASDIIEVGANYEQERPPGPGILWDRTHWYESLRTLQDLERRTDAEIIYGHEKSQLPSILAGWP